MAASLAALSCHDDIDGKDGMGRLVLTVDMNQTRAAFDPAAECIVKVYNGSGLIYRWAGVENIPAEQWLTVDSYTIKVTSGSEEIVAFDAPYYTGETAFEIEAGKTSPVTVDCNEVHALVDVAFSEALGELFTSCRVNVAAQAGSLDFDALTAGKTGYYTMAEGETTLAWSFTGTKADGSTFTKSGTVDDVKSATRHRLTFNYVIREGSLQFDVDVDLTTEDIGSEITIYQKPAIEGVGFDLGRPVDYTGGDCTVEIRAAADLTELNVSGSSLTAMGLGATTVSLLDEASAGELSAMGVTLSRMSARKMRVTFGSGFLELLPQGRSTLTISAADGKSAGSRATLTITKPITDPTAVSIVNDPVESAGIWATSATVSASFTGNAAGDAQFRYRAKGSDTWSYAAATTGDDNTLRAELTSLTPATTYEFQGMIGDNTSEGSMEFTTDIAPALPNGDFESWHKESNKIWNPWSADGAQFWDSGNDGSTTLGEKWNITTPEEDTRPGSGGKYSAKLKSTYPAVLGIGKFAAGNLFTGTYAGTEGTDGKIDFGRPFTARPRALRGWHKATVGVIDKAESGAPASSGDRDTGSIYIMLTDWSEPHRVYTADKSTLIDPDTTEGIIAYGHLDITEDVGDWSQFEIPLEYRRRDVRPTYILIVCSASKYGDYFTGSTSSMLMVDDLELVY